jgi:tellurite resistance protein TerC
MQRFHLLKYGLGLVLVWVGLKMTLLPYLFEDGKTPIPLSLGVIVALIGGSMALSVVLKPRNGAAGAPHA